MGAEPVSSSMVCPQPATVASVPGVTVPSSRVSIGICEAHATERDKRKSATSASMELSLYCGCKWNCEMEIVSEQAWSCQEGTPRSCRCTLTEYRLAYELASMQCAAVTAH